MPTKLNKKTKKKTKEKTVLSGTSYMTFLAAFLALAGTTILTGVGAFSRPVAGYSDTDKGQHYYQAAMISMSFVALIATIIYYFFLKYLAENKLSMEKVSRLRYADWFLTTPLLILSFTLYTSLNNGKESLDFLPLTYIIGLAYGALFFGFLGETSKMNTIYAFVLSFICVGAAGYFFYKEYIEDHPKVTAELKWVFGSFAGIFGLYTITYILENKNKNMGYNILDIIGRAGFGIFLWLTVIVNGRKEDIISMNDDSFSSLNFDW